MRALNDFDDEILDPKDTGQTPLEYYDPMTPIINRMQMHAENDFDNHIVPELFRFYLKNPND
jgi:hypothetical protein